MVVYTVVFRLSSVVSLAQTRSPDKGKGALTGFSSRNWPKGHHFVAVRSPRATSVGLKSKAKSGAVQLANYHLTAKTGSRKGGQSAKAKADYICRDGKYAHDKSEVLDIQHGNMPDFAIGQPSKYWDAADLYERSNGRLFKEVEFSLPIELTLKQQRELVAEFAAHLTAGEKLPFTLAIHAGGGTNPHCHLMISERINDGIERPAEQWFRRYNGPDKEGGAQKSESLKPKDWLMNTRKEWADFANAALKKAGFDDVSIDHRTLKAQGIERLPTIHLGANVIEMEAKGIRTARGDEALKIEQANAKIIDLQKYREAIAEQIDKEGAKNVNGNRKARSSAVIVEFRSRRNTQHPLSIMQARLELFEEKFKGRGLRHGEESGENIAKGDALRVLQLLDERSHLSLRAARAAEFSGGIAANECIREDQKRTGHRRPSSRNRAAGSSHGQADGRSAATDRRSRASQPEAGQRVAEEAAAGQRRMGGRGEVDEPSGKRAGRSERDSQQGSAGLDLEAVGRGDTSFSDAYGSAADRIVALAQSTGDDNNGGRNVADLKAKLKTDRTLQAVYRQLKAMNCNSYDIGIRDGNTGLMMNRVWTPQEVMENADWLKRMNAQGNDVYVRPAEAASHGLVLVDDLSSDDIDAMKAEGREPALVIETSPKNFQAWVKVADSVPADQRGAIAQQLAHEYDADKASADSRHYGRLAGFTNRKDKYSSRQGYQPWVLCRESSGKAATAGPELVQQATQELDAKAQKLEQGRRLEVIETAVQQGRRSVADEYKSEMRGLLKRFGDDLSKCDFIAAMNLAEKGRGAHEIGQAMAEFSPELATRKKGHEDDYINRTMQKVMELPRVQTARAELAEQKATKRPSRGPSFG